MGPVPQHPGGIRRGTLDALYLADVLYLVADGGKVWGILCPPLPGIPWGNPRQPFVTQGFQHGGGCHDLELGDSGGANTGGSGGTWVDNP